MKLIISRQLSITSLFLDEQLWKMVDVYNTGEKNTLYNKANDVHGLDVWQPKMLVLPKSGKTDFIRYNLSCGIDITCQHIYALNYTLEPYMAHREIYIETNPDWENGKEHELWIRGYDNVEGKLVDLLVTQ